MHASGGHSQHWRDSHCCDAFECDINDMSWMCQQGWFLTGTEEWHRPVGGFLLCTYWNVVIWNSNQVSCHGDAWLCGGVSCVRCGRLSELNMPHWRFSFYVAHASSKWQCMIQVLFSLENTVKGMFWESVKAWNTMKVAFLTQRLLVALAQLPVTGLWLKSSKALARNPSLADTACLSIYPSSRHHTY